MITSKPTLTRSLLQSVARAADCTVKECTSPLPANYVAAEALESPTARSRWRRPLHRALLGAALLLLGFSAGHLSGVLWRRYDLSGQLSVLSFPLDFAAFGSIRSRMMRYAAPSTARNISGSDLLPVRGRFIQADIIEKRLHEGLSRVQPRHQPWQWTQCIHQFAKDDGNAHLRISWLEKNPDWDYKLYFDDSADAYVRKHFKHVPMIVDAWSQFPWPVLRSDLFRLLVVYREGGLYIDTDTRCIRPIDTWLSAEMWNNTEITTVLGLEINWVSRIYNILLATLLRVF